MEDRKEDNYKPGTYAGIGVAIGSGVGFLLGMLMLDNPPIGVGIGVAWGIIIGSVLEAKRKKE